MRHAPDGQLDNFWRAHEANRRSGCTEASRDDEVTASLNYMAIDQVEAVVVQKIFGEVGQFTWPPCVWPQSVSETRSGTRRKMAGS